MALYPRPGIFNEKVTCRGSYMFGSYMLGSACGRCKRCRDEWAHMSTSDRERARINPFVETPTEEGGMPEGQSKTEVEKAGFVDADKLNWIDVSHEEYREYVYPSGFVYRVSDPLKVNVKQKSNGDSHRIVTKTLSEYIPVGWVALRWKPRDGTAPFQF